MKKIIISTLAVLIACPAFAGMHHADQGTWQMWGMDPYIGLKGGITWENMNYSFNNKKDTMTDLVFQGRAALGLEVCDTVRSEIEWSIFSKAKDHADFNTPERIDVHTKLQTLLWNSYWEFGDYQIVRPFFGLGVGAAFADVSRHGGIYGDHSSSKTRVAAMGTLGVSFDMEYFAVDLAARYNYIDVQSSMHNIGADIGIRFMF
ncbi:MAG: outer membrane beta-barrel protein [Muribaculaceae bacterium]|nr:outer membrane beta-barrel protein [Muribaculaceae bacterium]